MWYGNSGWTTKNDIAQCPPPPFHRCRSHALSHTGLLCDRFDAFGFGASPFNGPYSIVFVRCEGSIGTAPNHVNVNDFMDNFPFYTFRDNLAVRIYLPLLRARKTIAFIEWTKIVCRFNSSRGIVFWYLQNFSLLSLSTSSASPSSSERCLEICVLPCP